MSKIDAEYTARLAGRMKAAADWGQGHRSSAWGMVQHIASLAARRDQADLERDSVLFDQLCDELDEAVAEYGQVARELAAEVAGVEAIVAYGKIVDRLNAIGIETSTDSVLETLETIQSLTDEQIREIGAASDQSGYGDSRGWYIEDNSIVGWALVKGLTEDFDESVEITVTSTK